MRRLPFLNGVRAFEAAARRGSFAAAAGELNVTAAAVSRMVRLLEQRLGVVLFQRHANGLTLTPAGRAYQGGLTQIFDALANLTNQVKALANPYVLTVGVGPTFAIRWLIPRLASFRKLEPNIDVRITTGGAAAPFADDWTCGIKLGHGRWAELTAEPLFAADLVPVCTPALAASSRAAVRPRSRDTAARRPFSRRLAALAGGSGRRRPGRRQSALRVLRAGAASGRGRARPGDGHPALHR